MWPRLWKTTPNQFWYIYPTFDLATSEFHSKWMQFLPKDQEHSEYGWKPIFDRGQIKSIQFKSGVIVYFKAHSQKVQDLQAGTVYAMFCDEELPIEMLSELQFRLAATDGYFHMVFTATMGQDYWRRTIQPEGPDEELHVTAMKLQVSMYDCLKYEDGSDSTWTEEQINLIKQKCATQNEVLRRVYGKFVVSGGLKFESFDRERNTKAPETRPTDFRLWHRYYGIDYGSGGERGHPAAIVCVAVRPDYKKARVHRAWRGDGIVTTSPSILDKFEELKRGEPPYMIAAYDYSAKDMYVIASNRGITLTPADKKQEKGTDILNSLFKNEMLEIERGDPETEKLAVELTSVLKTTSKSSAKDDLCDALRYAVMHIPWDWTAVEDVLAKGKEPNFLPIVPQETDLERRTRERMDRHKKESSLDPVEEELLAWNELYEGD